MLEIYLEEQPDMENDIEELFSKVKINDINKIKEVIKLIEKGDLIDGYSFIDRFGYKLFLKELSTGCKAAICVIENPDRIINLIECGINARDVIVNKCEYGKVYIPSTGITFCDYKENKKVNIKLDNYAFTSIKRLNIYIQNERPFKPDMSLEGIKCLN